MIVAGGLLVLTAAFPVRAAPLPAADGPQVLAGILLLDVAFLGALFMAALRLMTPRRRPAPARRREP
jgi:hypothetical protein